MAGLDYGIYEYSNQSIVDDDDERVDNEGDKDIGSGAESRDSGSGANCAG